MTEQPSWFGTNAASNENPAPADAPPPAAPPELVEQLLQGVGTNAHSNIPGLGPAPESE